MYDEDFVYVACEDSTWVVDSGETFNTTSNNDFFTMCKPWEFCLVSMGNDGVSKIIRMGDIFFTKNLNIDYKMILMDVRHVLDLKLKSYLN